MDWIRQAVLDVIWRKRNAFYTEAVMKGIITPEQSEALLLLHLERDDASGGNEP